MIPSATLTGAPVTASRVASNRTAYRAPARAKTMCPVGRYWAESPCAIGCCSPVSSDRTTICASSNDCRFVDLTVNRIALPPGRKCGQRWRRSLPFRSMTVSGFGSPPRSETPNRPRASRRRKGNRAVVRPCGAPVPLRADIARQRRDSHHRATRERHLFQRGPDEEREPSAVGREDRDSKHRRFRRSRNSPPRSTDGCKAAPRRRFGTRARVPSGEMANAGC